MAKLYATSPNGTANSIQLETMNLTYSNDNGFGWLKLPNGIVVQWINKSMNNVTISSSTQYTINYAITVSSELASAFYISRTGYTAVNYTSVGSVGIVTNELHTSSLTLNGSMWMHYVSIGIVN